MYFIIKTNAENILMSPQRVVHAVLIRQAYQTVGASNNDAISFDLNVLRFQVLSFLSQIL